MDEFNSRNSTNSIYIIGFAIFAIFQGLVGLLFYDFTFGSGVISSTTYQMVIMVTIIILLIIGFDAYRKGMVPEAMILIIPPLLTFGFTFADVFVDNLMYINYINLIIAFVMLLTAYISYRIGDIFLLAIGVLNAIQQICFIGFGGEYGNTGVMITAFVTVAIALIYVAYNSIFYVWECEDLEDCLCESSDE